MSRLRNAWSALRGRPTRGYLFDDASMETVFKIDDVWCAGLWVFGFRQRYYPTCEQAHTAEPGRAVSTAQAVRIGDKLYRLPDDYHLIEIEFQPKPKVAKGKKGKAA